MPFVLIRRARCQIGSRVSGLVYDFEEFPGLEGSVDGIPFAMTAPDTLEVIVPDSARLVRDGDLVLLTYRSIDGPAALPAHRVVQFALQRSDGFAIHYDPEMLDTRWPPSAHWMEAEDEAL